MQRDLNISRKDFLDIQYKTVDDDSFKLFPYLMPLLVPFAMVFFIAAPLYIERKIDANGKKHCKSKAELIDPSNITVRFK